VTLSELRPAVLRHLYEPAAEHYGAWHQLFTPWVATSAVKMAGDRACAFSDPIVSRLGEEQVRSPVLPCHKVFFGAGEAEFTPRQEKPDARSGVGRRSASPDLTRLQVPGDVPRSPVLLPLFHRSWKFGNSISTRPESSFALAKMNTMSHRLNK
jgi:hypothetical protein